MDDLSPSPEALQAHLLRGVIEATAPPDETAADARLRAAIIIQAFQALAPANVLEAMQACHLISLQFVYEGALRALSAGVPSGEAEDAKAQVRLRAQVNTLSRTLGQWFARYETTQARREKRESEERGATTRETADAPFSAPLAVPLATPMPDTKRNEANAPARAPERTPPLPVAAVQGGPVPPRVPSPPVPPRVNGHAAPAALSASPSGG